MPDRAEIREARRWAALYKSHGFQPIPSDCTPGGRKKPLCRIKDWWEAKAPGDLFERFATTNIQVMTGRHWGLAVLDLDGPESIFHVEHGWPDLPPTWTVASGGGGRHLWYGIDPTLPPRGKDRLWGVWEPEACGGKGDWKGHVGVELLVDRCLIMAPPSVHPVSEKRYEFLTGRHPGCLPMATLPDWVWAMPAVYPPSLPPRKRDFVCPPRNERFGLRPYWPRVVEAIPDKAGLVEDWGLRFASQSMESDGWVNVHDFNRPDEDPSARFHPATGAFWRPGEKPMNLPWLGVALGVYRDWREAVDDLASRYSVA